MFYQSPLRVSLSLIHILSIRQPEIFKLSSHGHILTLVPFVVNSYMWQSMSLTIERHNNKRKILKTNSKLDSMALMAQNKSQTDSKAKSQALLRPCFRCDQEGLWARVP